MKFTTCIVLAEYTFVFLVTLFSGVPLGSCRLLHAVNVESHEEGRPFFFVSMVVTSPELVPYLKSSPCSVDSMSMGDIFVTVFVIRNSVFNSSLADEPCSRLFRCTHSDSP